MALKSWLQQQLARVSAKAKIAEEIRYGLNHWDGLTRFLDDGRIELDTNIVERGIRPIVLNRKNALFAGHDVGASYCSSGYALIKQESFGEDREISDALIAAVPRHRAVRRPILGRQAG